MEFRWSTELSLGDVVVDAQHRVLIERVAALGEAIRAGDLSSVEPMVAYLGDYALTHFEDEERLMQERAYPGYARHNAAHLSFVERFLELERDLRSHGADAVLAGRLHAWLEGWLAEHLAGEDRQLGRFLRRGAAPSQRARVSALLPPA
jgi:hemerythrin